MIPNRRQFMSSLAIGGFTAGPMLSNTIFEAQPAASGGDRLMEQLMSDLRQLSQELEASTGNRKATMRAIETTLGLTATHLESAYEQHIRTAISRREARSGHAAVVQEIVGFAHEHGNATVSFDTVEAALTRWQQRGLGGVVRDVQDITRRIRVQTPEPIQAISSRRLQWDYCSDLVWQIQLLEGMVAIVCAISVLEPTVGGEIACGALTLVLGVLLLEKMFFC